MTNKMKALEEFEKTFNKDSLSKSYYDLLVLRRTLLFEEYMESLEELDDLADLAYDVATGEVEDEPSESLNLNKRLLKELCDVLYVVYGTAYRLGYDLDGAFAEVHRSNMSKLGDDGKPVYREDGKVLKGPNYRPADVTMFLRRKED